MATTSPANTILVTRQPTGIAHITLNQPKTLNSLNKPMLTDLANAFKQLDSKESVKFIILSGVGRAFCSGIDMLEADDVCMGDPIDVENNPFVQIEQCRKSIIGAISGFAVTGGFVLALGCDIVVASKDI